MKSIYVANGECIFHDPGPEMIPTFLSMDQGFQIESIRPGNNFIPKFQFLKKQNVILEKSPLEYSPQDLISTLTGKVKKTEGTRNSALDILYVLCLKSLSNCSLCGWNCGVNRFGHEKGKCGLSSIVYAPSPFIHIAEEIPINPSLVMNLAGCAMHCRYCIDHRLLNTSDIPLLETNRYWQEAGDLVDRNTNSIEFTNPTESLHGIMHILQNSPEDFHMPLVMNCHLYGSCDFYQLADPITDVWLPDLRYGNNGCAKALSGADNYVEQVKIGLDAICKKGNRVIVRILILPGHVSCCHEPSIKLLSRYQENIWVSILDQYVPEHEAALDPVMFRRPTSAEIEEVNDLVRKYGLRDISDSGAEFWGDR